MIGAGNSSVDAALECWRAGAAVTLVHFGEGFDRTVKAWVLPDITNRVKEGSIAARWHSRVRAITPTEVEIVHELTGKVECLPTDAVLAMTGYHADTTMLQRLGVPVDPASGIPAHDERTMATHATRGLPRGGDRQRERRQPAVHRKRPGTWRTDRAGCAGEGQEPARPVSRTALRPTAA